MSVHLLVAIRHERVGQSQLLGEVGEEPALLVGREIHVRAEVAEERGDEGAISQQAGGGMGALGELRMHFARHLERGLNGVGSQRRHGAYSSTAW
jgi:hypothetical protein